MRDAGVSFLVGLGSALLASPAAAQLARLDHPGLDTARLRVLCSERAPAEHGARVRRQMVLSDSVRKIRPLKDPDLFDTLGCVNAMLYVDEPFVKPRDQTLRSPMAQASAMAFLQASELRPSDSLAAIGSATLAFEVTENRAFGSIWAETQRLAAASYAAVRAGVTAPIVLRMCAEFAIAAGDHATARHCLDVAYARGIDRSWNLERQALLAFMMGDEFATDGAASFDLAVSLARDSAARGEVGWHAAWLIDTTVTPSAHLLDAWRNSTDSGRVAWLHQQVAEHSATSGDGSPYVVRLARAFAIPGFLGGVIEQCPLPVTVNGFEQRRDRKGCLRDDVFPTRLVAVDAQLLRLWNPSSGEPVGVIGFGLGRAALRIDPGGRFDTPMTTVALTVRQFEWETAAWRDTVIRANLPLANDLAHPPVTGYVTLPLLRGTLTWTLAARQEGAYGALSTEGALALGTRGFVLSDLVVGVVEQGLSIPLDGDTITLAPLRFVKRNKPVELYYQLRGDSAANGVRTAITLHRIVQGHIAAEPALSMMTSTPVQAGINVVHRSLNIGTLVGSDFQLEVNVMDAAGKSVAKRWVNLIVK